MTPSATGQPRVDFRSPPVAEVAFSIQFDRPVIDEVGILSDFWPRIRSEYGQLEKHPPLPPATELFDGSSQPIQIQLPTFVGAVPQRYWFIDGSSNYVAQVQPDRLMFNWRKVTGDEKYPRYTTLLPKMIALLEQFLVCDQVTQADPTVAWVELQYTNPVDIEPREQAGHGQLAKILNLLVDDPQRSALPPVEDTQLQERFRIETGGVARGRLYLTAGPGILSNGARAYNLNLLARGRPGPGGLIDGVTEFLDLGHALIVTGFREVTTDGMRALWGES